MEVGNRAILRRPDASAADAGAVADLAADLGSVLALALLFVSPRSDFAATMRAASLALGDSPIVGCTSAGEIAGGHVEDRIVAVSFLVRDFAAKTIAIEVWPASTPPS